MSDKTTVFEVKNLHKTFYVGFFRKKVEAVRGVDLTVFENEIFGLLGPNGAGKTTLMRILTSYLYPSKGTAVVNGSDVTGDSLSVRKLLGYMPEAVPLYDDMLVDEYLIFLGCEFPDLVGSFDAEIEIFIGKEYERHIVNKATVLYIPAGVEHNPCDIRRVGKPFMFSALHLAPYFNHINQRGEYMVFRKGFAAD